MNTSVQIKTHTNKSASYRSVENLRESNKFTNPHIEVLLKTPNYKFVDDVIPVQRADANAEKKRQAELRKVNNKINTYKKRLEVFKAQNNTKKVESLSKQIEDLKQQKEHLQEVKNAPENRGKKREKNYVEFIFSLTNSNEFVKDKKMQDVLKKAFERMKKTKLIKQLEGITGALHLDQHSLHIHYIAKLPKNTTWDEIVKEGFEYNPQKTEKENAKIKREFGSKAYKNIQNSFMKCVKEEIVKSNFKNHSTLISFSHSKGAKYLPLSKFKELNPLKPINEAVEAVKEPLNAPKINLRALLDAVDKKSTAKAVGEVFVKEKDNDTSFIEMKDFDFENLTKNVIKTKEIANLDMETSTGINDDSHSIPKNNPESSNKRKRERK